VTICVWPTVPFVQSVMNAPLVQGRGVSIGSIGLADHAESQFEDPVFRTVLPAMHDCSTAKSRSADVGFRVLRAPSYKTASILP